MKPDVVIRASTQGTVVGIGGIAAVVSFRHALEVVRAHGENGFTAYLTPFTVDGLVFCASMAALDAARRGDRVPRLARFALVLGIAATVAVNVLHGLAHGPVGAVVGAWPAVTLVLVVELLMGMIRRGRQASPTTPDPNAQRAEDAPDGPAITPGRSAEPSTAPAETSTPQRSRTDGKPSDAPPDRGRTAHRTGKASSTPRGGGRSAKRSTRKTGTSKPPVADVDDLMPLGWRIVADLDARGTALTRDVLAVQLRQAGHTAGNARVGALLTRLKTEAPAEPTAPDTIPDAGPATAAPVLDGAEVAAPTVPGDDDRSAVPSGAAAGRDGEQR